MRKGWFRIDGVQEGDRTVGEQMRGVEKALAECHGKTVLDLGAAECLIARQFAIAGAKHVHAVEILADHLAVAAEVVKGLTNVSLQQGDLKTLEPQPVTFDIVLALGVAHKLKHPEIGIRYAATASHDLVLVRMSRQTENGILCSKHWKTNCCNVRDEMKAAGFVLESIEPGPREETVHYYRKQA
jgi:predicted RNA methylase